MGARGTIGETLDPRRNALNAIRLALALLVVVSHAWPLGGFGHDPKLLGVTLGTWAVDGFFVISGYLIVGSRATATSGGRYLWHRALRIFPALWVCLALTVAAAWVVTGTLGWSYLWRNAVLQTTYGIGGGPAGVPYPGAWNGPLWTLPYELGCYLAVAAVAALPALRRRVVVAGFAVALLALNVQAPSSLFELALMFAAGGLLFAFRDRVPDSRWLAAVSVAGLAVVAVWPPLAAFPLAYLMLWLGVHVPIQSLTERRDVSYGVYIYAWPVGQMLALAGVQRFGVAAFLAACVAGALPLAALSRVLVETPARRFKGVALSLRALATTAVVGVDLGS